MLKSPSPKTLAATVVILATVLLSFGGTLWNGFVYDDVDLLQDNPRLKALMARAPGGDGKPHSHLADMVFSDFAHINALEGNQGNRKQLGYFRPVIAVSYVVDTLFWSSIRPYPPGEPLKPWNLQWDSLNPFGFHFTNLLFHTLNSLLVFLLVRSLTRRFLLALSVGTLFAAHPIHVESVCWIAGRTDVIATTFFLAAFQLYLAFRQRGGWMLLGGSLFLLLLGLLTKEAVLVLPLVLLALELILPHPGTASRWKALAGPIPFLVMIPVYFLLRHSLMPGEAEDTFVHAGTSEPISVLTLCTTFLQAGGWYVGKCLWPFPLNLYADLPFIKATAFQAWLPFLFLHAALAALAIFLAIRRRASLVAFALLSFYLSLAPLSCILPGTRLARFVEDQDFPVAERFLYIPSLFALLAVGFLIVEVLGKRTMRTALCLVLALAAASVGVTLHRCGDYRNNFTFFQAAIRTAPRSVRMHMGLGTQFLDRYDVEEGLRHFLYARHLVDHVYRRTEYPPIQNGLAAAYRLKGDTSQVVESYRTALEKEPGNPDHALNLAVTEWTRAILKMDVACIKFAHEMARRAVHQAPANPMAAKALDHINRARKIWDLFFVKKKRDDTILFNLGMSFYVPAMGALQDPSGPRYGDALHLLRQGLRHVMVAEEKRGAMPQTLGVQELLKTRFEEAYARAHAEYSRLLNRYPGSAALRFLLGEVLAAGWQRTGDARLRDQALEAYLECARREPGHVAAVIHACLILTDLGRHEKAMALVRAGVHDLLEQKTLGTWPVPLRPRQALDIIGNVAGRQGLPRAWKSLFTEQVEKVLHRVTQRAQTMEGGRNADLWDEVGYFRVFAARALGRTALLHKAVEAYEKALDIDPDHGWAKQNLNTVLEQLETRKKGKK